MANTPNYGLKQPGVNDFYNVEDFNHNFGVVDAELKRNADKVNKVDAVEQTLGNMVAVPTTAKDVAGAVTELHNKAQSLQTDVNEHKNTASIVSNATSEAVAGRLITRDANGRAKVTVPVDANDMARLAEIQSPPFVITTGTGTDYLATFVPAYPNLKAGTRITIKMHLSNTGAATINVNDLGKKSILKSTGSTLASGNLKQNSVYTLVFDGSVFILQGEGGSGTAQPANVLSGFTFSNDAGDQTGAMVDRAGDTAAVSSAVNGTTLRLRASEGYRDGVNDFVTLTDADFIAANIRNDTNLFGLAGTLMPKYQASGTATSSTTTQTIVTPSSSVTANHLTVTGLNFQPQIVIVSFEQAVNYSYFAVYVAGFSFHSSSPLCNHLWGYSTPYPMALFGQASGDFAQPTNGFKLPVYVANSNFSWTAIG
ncbi:hypothetical protein ACFQZE_12630 [Paenibacillus sp. GCM10027627]|uniref:hypothetical protein n=1 Tax=unclassified Paenibacillus TaxID=185978 RepID=UPI0036408C97